jgi:hypothetical protein
MHYLLASCLGILSYLFFISFDAYHIEGEQKLKNSSFSEGLKGWNSGGYRNSIEVSDGGIIINHSSSRQVSFLTNCLKRSELPDRVIATIEAKTAGLEVGPESWHEARAGLIGHFPDGRKEYQDSGKLLSLYQDSSWERYQETFQIAQGYERVCLIVALFRSNGEFQFRNPALYQAKMSAEYFVVRNIILCLWVVSGGWWFVLLLKHYSRRPQLGYFVIMFLIIAVGILMPKELKNVLEKEIFTFPEARTTYVLAGMGLSINQLPSLFPEMLNISKLGHFLSFALLSGILLSEKEKTVLVLLPGLILTALITELMQYFIPGRSPLISDVAVDLVGIFTGWWLIKLSLWIRQSLAGTG